MPLSICLESIGSHTASLVTQQMALAAGGRIRLCQGLIILSQMRLLIQLYLMSSLLVLSWPILFPSFIIIMASKNSCFYCNYICVFLYVVLHKETPLSDTKHPVHVHYIARTHK